MFVHGFNQGITWTQDGGAAVPVNVTGWDVNDAGDLVEITHTGTNGQQAFLACVQRADGRVTFNFDNSQVPSSIGLKFGVKGTIAFNTGSTQPWSIHVSIEKVGHKSTVNGVISVELTIKSDAINSQGAVVNSITYPT